MGAAEEEEEEADDFVGLEEEREDSPRCHEVAAAAVRGAAVGAGAETGAETGGGATGAGAGAAGAGAKAAGEDVVGVAACSLLGPSLAEVEGEAESVAMLTGEEAAVIGGASCDGIDVDECDDGKQGE